MWRDLKTDPPTGDRPVILFPIKTDVGILYQASNPEYARVNGLKYGYTSWMEIPEHPEERVVAEGITRWSDECYRVQQLYDPLIDRLHEMLASDDLPLPLAVIDTAMEVLASMVGYGIAVPLMTWDAEAIILLWKPDDAHTVALTITEDEVGIVTRRDGKRERMEPSISIYDFAYEDLKNYVGPA